jgi:hypothetical protein
LAYYMDSGNIHLAQIYCRIQLSPRKPSKWVLQNINDLKRVLFKANRMQQERNLKKSGNN